MERWRIRKPRYGQTCIYWLIDWLIDLSGSTLWAFRQLKPRSLAQFIYLSSILLTRVRSWIEDECGRTRKGLFSSSLWVSPNSDRHRANRTEKMSCALNEVSFVCKDSFQFLPTPISLPCARPKELKHRNKAFTCAIPAAFARFTVCKDWLRTLCLSWSWLKLLPSSAPDWGHQ